MKTIDLQDLHAVCGGTLDNKAASATLTIPTLPKLPPLQLPKPPRPDGTIPLGPFVPPTNNPYIA